MKKLFLSLLFTSITTMMMAVPAKRGIWKTLKLADGTEVRAELRGDEHVHFWQAEDGRTFDYAVEEGRVARPVSVKELNRAQMVRRATIDKARGIRRQAMRKASSFTGVKRGLVILAQYKDVSFTTGHDQALYEEIMNEENYTANGFKGSVRDYFKAQSDGVFDLQFDVVGPVTLSKNQSYYGGNDSRGSDKHPGEMVAEACKLVDSEVDFSKYDWNGNKEVDQVYVVYAGQGEADSQVANTVWPHEFQLSAAGEYGDGPGALSLDGVRVDTYACGSELDYAKNIEGIGTFCHEFSHCLGYPDMYDTDYKGHLGTGDYDLMCSGSYNGNGFKPAGYTGWEKWQAGWVTPIELKNSDVEVTNLKPLSEGGDVYIIYNPAYSKEYYTIENRQKTQWDASLPGKGLMIVHADYDREKFASNIVNTIYSYDDAYQEAYEWYYSYYENGQLTKTQLEYFCKQYAEANSNDHQRMCIIRADNTESERSEGTDLYPYGSNNSLTSSTKPAASLFHANSDGTLFMNCSILDIKQNSDRTMAFKYKAPGSSEPDPEPEPEPEPEPDPVLTGDSLFYETFDKCNGTGGNDGSWSGSIATSNLYTDFNGWTFTKGNGANQCAKLGTTAAQGVATTPAIALSGKATLTFRAAAWNSTTESKELLLSAEGGTISPAKVTLALGEWGEYTADVEATDSVKISFTSSKNMRSRFFLDDVLLMKASEGGSEVEDGIAVTATDREGLGRNTVYDLMGRRVLNPKRGLYIVNGRKMIIR